MRLNDAWARKHLRLKKVVGDEAECFCPMHGDKNRASLSLNLRTGMWFCFSKCGGGTLQKLCAFLKVPVPEITDSERLSVDTAKYVPPNLLAAAQTRLWSTAGVDARNYLLKRGITKQALKDQKIGYGEDDRVWFPVYDHEGDCVNVRRYDWSKVQGEKFLNFREGYGEAAIWPAGVMEKNDEVILFEGEPDVLLAHSLGIANAVCSTGGAGTWKDDWTRALTGKSVLVCYDIDDAGRQGAATVARKLLLAAKRCQVVELPISQPKHGDFTDYVLAVKGDRKVVHDLFAGYRAKGATAARYHFSQLAKAAPSDQSLLQLRAVVSGKDLTPFNVPAEVTIACVPSEKSSACQLCPLKGFGGRASFPIPVTSKPVLQAVLAEDSKVERAIADYCDIPARCPGKRINITKSVPLWDLRLSPDVDSGEEEGAEGSRRAFSMEGLLTNQPYDLELMACSDPKTQYSLLHILRAKTSLTSLDAWTTAGKELLLKLWEPASVPATPKKSKKSTSKATTAK